MSISVMRTQDEHWAFGIGNHQLQKIVCDKSTCQGLFTALPENPCVDNFQLIF